MVPRARARGKLVGPLTYQGTMQPLLKPLASTAVSASHAVRLNSDAAPWTENWCSLLLDSTLCHISWLLSVHLGKMPEAFISGGH